MERIQISNHPNEKLKEVERFFEFLRIETDLKTFAKTQGVVKYEIDGKTPKGFNINGDDFPLTANTTTLVDSKTGAYSIEGDTTEIEYLRNMPISVIEEALGKENLNIGEVLEWLVKVSVQKQDAYKRFDK